MKIIQPVRGTHDLLPDVRQIHLKLEHKARNIASLYGFEEVATPIFEFTEVFEATLGVSSDVVKKEMRSKALSFFNIDIEGHELEVLKTIDFDYFKIKVICIEVISYASNINKREKEIVKFLRKKKYLLKFKFGINYIFVRK